MTGGLLIPRPATGPGRQTCRFVPLIHCGDRGAGVALMQVKAPPARGRMGSRVAAGPGTGMGGRGD